MPKQTNAPAAPAPTPAPASEPMVPPPAPAARESDNVSGAELAAALKRAREAKASRSAPAEPPAEPQPPTPDNDAPPAPAAEAPPENDETNAAPAPEETPAEPIEETPTTPPAEEPAEPPLTPQEKKSRIDQLTAKWRQAERELAEAREELETMRSQPAEEPRSATPAAESFGADSELQTITKAISERKAELKWITENPNGGEISDANGKVIYRASEAQAMAMAEELPEVLGDLRAMKAARITELSRQHRTAVAQSEATVAKRFPWVKEAKNEGAEMLRTIEQRVPELARVPGWKLLAAYGLEAMRAEQARLSAPVRPASATPPKVAVPSSAAAPRGVNGASRKLAEAEAAFEKSGRAEDLKRVMALRREARMATA